MTKPTRAALLMSFLLFLVLPAVNADNFTLSTYYPAPNGVYERMTVTKELNAPGVISGGGEEKVDFSGQPSKAKMAYEDGQAPFSCQAWGGAECPQGVAGALACKDGSEKVLTGVFMDNGMSQLNGHGVFFVKWYVCVVRDVVR